MTGPLPKITVVIAVRNGAATIQLALDSVFEQTYEHIEVIVIDGGSIDGTAALVEENAARIAHWESRPDRGVYHAWNKALDHATGDWICFLGADDRFHAPDVIERMASALRRDASGHRVAYGAVRVVDREGSTQMTVGAPWTEVRDDFLTRMSIPHQATMHHRSLFDRQTRFDERYRICGDYEFLLREILVNEPLFVPDLTLVDMSTGGLSSDPMNAVRMTREFHRARFQHGLEDVPEWRSFRVIRAVVHAWLTRLFGRRMADSVAHAYRFIVRRSSRRAS